MATNPPKLPDIAEYNRSYHTAVLVTNEHCPECNVIVVAERWFINRVTVGYMGMECGHRWEVDRKDD